MEVHLIFLFYRLTIIINKINCNDYSVWYRSELTCRLTSLNIRGDDCLLLEPIQLVVDTEFLSITLDVMDAGGVPYSTGWKPYTCHLYEFEF